jgi:hypothetical protein
MIDMPPELTPWVIIGVFVTGLATTIIIGLRALISGKIVVGRHYDDALKREAAWQKVAETLLETNREGKAHMDTLVASVRESSATQQKTLDLVRQLAPPPPMRDAA